MQLSLLCRVDLTDYKSVGLKEKQKRYFKSDTKVYSLQSAPGTY